MKSKYKQRNLRKAELLLVLAVIMISFGGCKKYLDKKPNISDVIPTSLDDLQSLLDNARTIMNSKGTGGYAELIADNIYVPLTNFQSAAASVNPLLQSEAQNYIWGNLTHEQYWSSPYQGPIYYANIVLDHLSVVTTKPDEGDKYNNLKGAALFYRAFAFEGLAQLFCKPFSDQNANEPGSGIVLRLTSNVSEQTPRATIQQTYDRIIADLNEAATLLPDITAVPPTLRTRPSKTAAYAALARTYLSMRDYANARAYADKALQQYNKLIDYNTLVAPPIKALNDEVIFHNYSPSFTFLSSGTHKIDSSLYLSYSVNDLRKTIFFKQNNSPNTGTYFFQGSYNGTLNVASVFDGLATDELFLIRAECMSRAGNKDSAMSDLNNLLRNRWKKVNGVTTYVDQVAGDANEALNKVLIERRKELVFRGLRWSDIRRLNLEDANITLTRNIGGTFYTLPPNDIRSTMLISLAEIKNNPGVQQNTR